MKDDPTESTWLCPLSQPGNGLQKLGTLKNVWLLTWLIMAENTFLILTTFSRMLQLILASTPHT